MRNFLFVILMFSTPLLAQEIAVEKVDQRDIHFRGQGSNPWCFAFSEEQTIKDTLCNGPSCATNAAQFEISIFDIAKAHKQWSQIQEAKSKSAMPDRGRDIDKLFRGSGDFFVFQDLGIKSVRTSRCTLEKELFRWNRTAALNPDKKDLLQQLDDFAMWNNWGTWGKWDEAASKIKSQINAQMNSKDWKKLNKVQKNATLTSLQYYQDHFEKIATTIRANHFENLYTTLHEIHQEQNLKATSPSFAEAVFDYKKCDEQIDVSNLRAEKMLLSDVQEIKAKLHELLLSGKSVSLGVCAEVLEKEEMGSMDSCGSHAVTAKDKRTTNGVTDLLIVDSAFFSERPRNSDGSIWIPEEIVAQAVAKHGLRLTKIREDYVNDIKALEQQLNGERENLKSGVSASIKEFDAMLEKQGAIAKKNLKRYNGKAGLKRFFESLGDDGKDDPKTQADIEAEKAMTKKVESMPFKTEQDVDALIAFMRTELIESMKNVLNQPLDMSKTEVDIEAILSSANNLSWLEKTHR